LIDQAGERQSELRKGTLLNKRYLIEAEIGRGGIGSVYLAYDQRLYSSPVVVKLLQEGAVTDENRTWFRKKFQQEIKALSRIDHPGVVRALDVGEISDGRAFLVMQYVEGVNLRSVLKSGTLPLTRVARIVQQIGHALNAAHERGIFHRDLKPENIMVQVVSESEEYVKLIDFGIATVLDSLDSPTNPTTRLVGTIGYMAPEQLMGKPTAASDIYALGVIAYEMVAGRRPFEPATPFQLLELQREGVRTAPGDLRPELPSVAQDSILKALEYDSNNRQRRAREFGDELAEALLGESTTSEQLPPEGKTSSGDSQNGEVYTSTVLVSEPLHRNGEATVRDSFQEASDAMARHRIGLRIPVQRLLSIAIVLILVLAAAVMLLRPRDNQPKPPTPQWELSCSVTVQKDPERFPNEKPFQLSGETLFGGDNVRLNLMSSRPGFLYVINEGLEEKNRPDYNLIFPYTTSNNGSAELTANTEVSIPERHWLKLDTESGTEYVWLILSEHAIPQLEAIKHLAGPKDKGAVTNPADKAVITSLITGHRSDSPAQDENNRYTFKANGDILVGLVKIEHRGPARTG
jgi:serine/threonine protein kinase